MQYVYAVASFLGGLGAFLIGVKLLSESMEKLANNRLKSLFNKTSKNGFVGVGIGLVSTMVVQSSSLTTVMVVGLVNAGIMSLYQATTIIMGANIGTTITAQIAALQTFDFISLAMALTSVGAFTAMFAKKDGTKAVANLMCGLGLIFLGLQFMSDSMRFFRESEVVTNAFASVENPFLLLLIGIIVTGIIQSSSAVTSIIISMAAAGIVIGSGGNSVLYVVLGTNIGTCVTALMSSIGTGTNARRAALIHLMFNTFGAVLFMTVLLIWPGFMGATFERWFPGLPATQIAMFHTFFNVVCTALFLPLAKVFVKISIFIIRDKKNKTKAAVSQTFLDERILNTPAVAMNQTVKETARMCGLSMNGLTAAFEAFIAKDGAGRGNKQKHTGFSGGVVGARRDLRRRKNHSRLSLCVGRHNAYIRAGGQHNQIYRQRDCRQARFLRRSDWRAQSNVCQNKRALRAHCGVFYAEKPSAAGARRRNGGGNRQGEKAAYYQPHTQAQRG